MSVQPEAPRRTTVVDIAKLHADGVRIATITAYDFPTAALVDQAGIPLILVGDSLGQVVLGYESTVRVSMDEMLHHTRAVTRGARQALVVADMPFLSYQVSLEEGVRNAGRFLKEGGAHAVKIEGPHLELTHQLTELGIPVMGHVGLTPQSVHGMGGYKVQGRDEEAAIGSIALELGGLGLRAMAQLFLKDATAARNSLAEAEQLGASRLFGLRIALPVACLRNSLLDLQSLEAAIGGESKSLISECSKAALESGKKTVSNSAKWAAHRMGSCRLRGVYFWLLGKQRKAFRWFDKSVREGERLQARPEVARTYMEMGKRLIQPCSKSKKQMVSVARSTSRRQGQCLGGWTLNGI